MSRSGPLGIHRRRKLRGEKIVQDNFVCHQFFRVLIGLDALRSAHGQEQGLLTTRASTKDTEVAFPRLRVALRDHVGLVGKFDLANVDAMIGSIQQEIDLSPLFV